MSISEEERGEGDLVEIALSAFRSDPYYLESVGRAGRNIKIKRRIWLIRTAVKKAQTAAQDRCKMDGISRCFIPDPCGSGCCPYSSNITSTVEVGFTSGTYKRPEGVASPFPKYDVEKLVSALVGN